MYHIFFCLMIVHVVKSAKYELRQCPLDEFPCFNGECIKKRSWCDGEFDCRDQTDEVYCNLKSSLNYDPNQCSDSWGFFMCRDGMCIPKAGVCDGLNSCSDGSDEEHCENRARKAKLLERQNHPVSKDYVGDKEIFTDLDIYSFKRELNFARQWLLSQQNKDFGWGSNTHRAIIAIYLSKMNLQEKSPLDQLMKKQLDIELSMALARNQTEKMPLGELALYIKALMATCGNPKNFYGSDLTSILRRRVSTAHISNATVSPFVYLTLCMNNMSTNHDIRFLQELVKKKLSSSNEIDILSMSILASSCMIKMRRQSKFFRDIVVQLLKLGMPGNVYELALFVQALNEAKVPEKLWNRSKAINLILKSQNKFGSFGDLLATYYVMPILSGRSALSLAHQCNYDNPSGNIPLAVLKNSQEKKIRVTYSLRFGNPVEMTQKMKMKVSEGTHFLDIMRLAQEENESFRFKLDDTKKKPSVYSIGGILNDAERGIHWTLYVTVTNTSDLVPYNEDIRHLVPKDCDKPVFWLRSL